MPGSPVEFRGWTGINLREKPNIINDTEMVSCLNFDLGRSGELVKRQGANRIHFGEDLGSNSVRLLGHFKTPSVSYLVGTAGGGVYYSGDGESWTLLVTANVEFGVQYTNKFYLIRTDGVIIEWDPSSTTELLLIDEVDFEQDTIEGWGAVSGVSALESDTAKFLVGTRSMKLTASGGTAIIRSRTISATEDYDITATVQTNASAVRTVRLQIQYLDSGSSVIQTTNQDLSSVIGSWQLHSVSAAAPANTAFLRVNIEFQGATAAETINFDTASIKLVQNVPRLVDGSPRGTTAIVFKDRLFVVNSEGAGNVNSRLYFSEIGDFADWPSVNFIDVLPGEGDFLTSLAIIQDILVVFKTESIWGLYVQGAPENWALRILSPEIGCVSRDTPQEIEGFLYFVGRRGVYRTDGNSFEDIAEPLQGVFQERITNLSTANLDSASWWNDRYVLLFYPTPTTIRYFVYHLRRGGWTEWSFGAGTEPSSFLEVSTAAPEKGLYAGCLDASGKVFRFGDDVYLDEGSAFSCSFKSKDYAMDATVNMKRILWVAMEHEGQGTIVVNHYAQQQFVNSVDVVASAANEVTKAQGPGYVRSYQFEVSHADSYPLTFYALIAMLIPKRTVVNSGV